MRVYYIATRGHATKVSKKFSTSTQTVNRLARENHWDADAEKVESAMREKSNDAIATGQARLQELVPESVELYASVIRKKIKANTRTRLDVADRILRGTGTHVEKKREERSTLPASPQDVFAAMREWSESEHDEFRDLCLASESVDTSRTSADVGVVAGEESSPDTSRLTA